MIPRTKARKAYPGDTSVTLLESATDSLGRAWKKGEVFTPLCSGYDNVRGCDYVEFGNPPARFEGQR